MKSPTTTRSTSFLRKHTDIVKELSEKYKLSEEQSTDLLEHFFRTFKEFLVDERMPKIVVPKLGIFRPTRARVEWQIRNAIKLYRLCEKKGLQKCMDFQRAKISRLWKIRRRIIDERKGFETYSKWKLPQDDFKVREVCQYDTLGNLVKRWPSQDHVIQHYGFKFPMQLWRIMKEKKLHDGSFWCNCD